MKKFVAWALAITLTGTQSPTILLAAQNVQNAAEMPSPGRHLVQLAGMMQMGLGWNALSDQPGALSLTGGLSDVPNNLITTSPLLKPFSVAEKEKMDILRMRASEQLSNKTTPTSQNLKHLKSPSKEDAALEAWTHADAPSERMAVPMILEPIRTAIANVSAENLRSMSIEEVESWAKHAMASIEGTAITGQTAKTLNIGSARDPAPRGPMFSAQTEDDAKLIADLTSWMSGILLRFPETVSLLDSIDSEQAGRHYRRIIQNYGTTGLTQWLVSIERWRRTFAAFPEDFPDLDVDSIVAIAQIVPLDEYSLDTPLEAARKIYIKYWQDRGFLKLRELLATGRMEELRRYAQTRGFGLETLVKAAVMNRQSDIISQTSDLILDHAGSKGIMKNMTPLRDKIDYKTFTRQDLETLIKATGASIYDIEAATKRIGYRFFKSGETTLVIPLAFDVLLSGYRGSAEHDNSEANYLTHAPTTAIVHYANKGGEAKKGESAPYGPNAFHEFDLGLLALVGRTDREVDRNVSLAFSYHGLPLPEYARKRTRILADTTVADHIQTIMEQQQAERRAKQDIYKIFSWVRTGALNADKLVPAQALLRKRLDTLRTQCGLKKDYFEAVFGFVDDVFFEQLRSTYKPGQDNAAELQRILSKALQGRTVLEAAERKDSAKKRTTHPWLKIGTTLWDYLEHETEIRKGTFDEVDLHSVRIEDLN